MKKHRIWKNIKSLLVVDDESDALDLYCDLLRKRGAPTVYKTRFPSHAEKLASEHFFDVIIIDVTMNYNGSPFGGLDLYKALVRRYGSSSIVAYSQYVTDDLLRQYDYNFNFIEKSADPKRFIDNLLQFIAIARKRQTCFVAMPFEEKYFPVYRVVEKCVRRSGYICVRVDGLQFTGSIIKQIFDGIQKSKLIIFLATDKNPNAYYECGYSVALQKEVITLTDRFSNLPFDIRDRNAIAYGESLAQLQAELEKKLTSLTRIHK